jgi:hypothetical protein
MTFRSSRQRRCVSIDSRSILIMASDSRPAESHHHVTVCIHSFDGPAFSRKFSARSANHHLVCVRESIWQLSSFLIGVAARWGVNVASTGVCIFVFTWTLVFAECPSSLTRFIFCAAYHVPTCVMALQAGKRACAHAARGNLDLLNFPSARPFQHFTIGGSVRSVVMCSGRERRDFDA